MRVLPAGPTGLLVEVESVDQALALYAQARSADPGVTGGVTDLVPAARTVLFDGVGDPPRLRGWLEAVELSRHPPGAPVREVEVPTVYDGVDLADVARLWGMTPEAVVSTHTSTEFVVAFCGFAPGFAYCTGLAPHLAVPRLDSPRSKVPAGSVGLAGEFTGVYPTASPGGWRLVGRTSVTLWDPAADEPAHLQPGCRVRFVAVEG